MQDRDVIDAFVAHLEANGHPGLRVDRRPDEENRESSDIDALACPFAIEHTSIDTLPDQRRHSAWFKNAVRGIKQELDPTLTFRLYITLEYDAISKGQNWDQIRDALKAWVHSTAHMLPEGRSVIDNAPGIPFHLGVYKYSDRRPGVFLYRYPPNENALPEKDTLSNRVETLFNRNAKKLAKYKQKGCTTILLLESKDIELMNEPKILGAIQMAFPSGAVPDVDQVWYADTSIKSELLFCILELHTRTWQYILT